MAPRGYVALLSATWFGALLAVALIAAPSAFAVLDRSAAGALVARLFAIEAPLSLCAAVAVVCLERWHLRRQDRPPRPTAVILGALAALFCTVAGYYALQPMMEAARQGQGRLGFGTLHLISMLCFAVKGLVVGWMPVIALRPGRA